MLFFLKIEIIFFYIGLSITSAETHDRKYPYQATLLLKGEIVCGGAIVNTQGIITAASCFKGGEAK